AVAAVAVAVAVVGAEVTGVAATAAVVAAVAATAAAAATAGDATNDLTCFGDASERPCRTRPLFEASLNYWANRSREVTAVAKEEAIQAEGRVKEALANTQFRVELDNGHHVIAHVAGRMRKNF